MFSRQIILCIIFLISSPFFLPAQSKFPGVAVVELFTSQGDINSTEADKILSEIIAEAAKENKPVFGISEHVDFWNRFGWKDPFSNFKYTNRLQNYSAAFGDKETYTPRFLINGKPTGPNPDRKKINGIIDRELNMKAALSPTFVYELFDDTLDVSYSIAEELKKSKSGSLQYLNIVIVEKGLTTKVSKGDNAGKTLLNDNVARLFYTTDLRTQKGLVRVPMNGLKPGAGKSIILFIQDKKTREITGSTSISFEKK